MTSLFFRGIISFSLFSVKIRLLRYLPCRLGNEFQLFRIILLGELRRIFLLLVKLSKERPKQNGNLERMVLFEVFINRGSFFSFFLS